MDFGTYTLLVELFDGCLLAGMFFLFEYMYRLMKEDDVRRREAHLSHSSG